MGVDVELADPASRLADLDGLDSLAIAIVYEEILEHYGVHWEVTDDTTVADLVAPLGQVEGERIARSTFEALAP